MKQDEFLKLARKRLKKCIDADTHNRLQAIEDLKFSIGIDQWDPAEKTRRSQRGRPSIQINLLPKYIKQVTGDLRENRPKVKVKPVDSKADPHLARIREGIINNVEYLSGAESIYDYASKMMATCGYGSWRILTRYTEEDPFVQEIYMEIVRNPFMVFMDVNSKDANYSDADYGFVLCKMPREEFEEEYPGKKIPGEILQSTVGMSYENWYDKDTITVAEYFIREKRKQKMVQLKTGETLSEEDFNVQAKEWRDKKQATDQAFQEIMMKYQQQVQQMQQQPQQGQQGQPPPPPQPTPLEDKPEIAKRRTTELWTIKHYTITGDEILKGPEDFPGKYVPIILLKGEEPHIEGKPYVEGLIRQAKDPQKLFNYWTTAAAETVALAPKAPWVLTGKQIEGYESDYAKANVENYPYLLYNPDDRIPNTPPQRTHTGDPPLAMFTQIEKAEQNIRNTIGIGKIDVAEDTPERTGAAVTNKQKPGDVSTFAYSDNLRKAIAHSGKIINEMIPEVYDSERDVRLRDVDDVETAVPINTTAMAALKKIKESPEQFQGMDIQKLRDSIKEHGQNAKFNDLSVGKYDVVVVTGPSYATQRTETAEAMQRIIAAYPDLMKIAGDIVMGNMDFKDADKLSKRLEKTLPMGLREQKEGEPPPQPLPPPPQVQVLMEKTKTEQIKQQVQTLAAKLKIIEIYKETKETEVEMRKLILKVLAELTGPEHPADKILQQGQGMMAQKE